MSSSIGSPRYKEDNVCYHGPRSRILHSCFFSFELFDIFTVQCFYLCWVGFYEHNYGVIKEVWGTKLEGWPQNWLVVNWHSKSLLKPCHFNLRGKVHPIFPCSTWNCAGLEKILLRSVCIWFDLFWYFLDSFELVDPFSWNLFESVWVSENTFQSVLGQINFVTFPINWSGFSMDWSWLRLPWFLPSVQCTLTV